MQIRLAHDNDIAALAKLMWSLSAAFIVHDSPADTQEFFQNENNEAGMRRFIAEGVVYRVAEVNGAVVGFIAIRDQQHLFHMFVDQAYHGQGIARALWSAARADANAAGNPGLFTVNSSNFAVPVYEALGFLRTAPTQCKNGIYYNPMQLDERTG